MANSSPPFAIRHSPFASSYSSRPSAWSIENRPPPLIRNTSATIPISREYSRPPVDQKNTLPDVNQTALIMKMKIAAAANRVRNPTANMKPPTSSVSATRVSQNDAGYQPILSKKSANFPKPMPPNQPNSFWQPCGIRMSPITSRNSGSAIGSNVA